MDGQKAWPPDAAVSQVDGTAEGQPRITPSASAASRNSTACFSCRLARQKCDRLEPCARCAAQSRPCRYPAMSNRGRKKGSVNKPDTVEKLLLRISESPVGEEVVQIIIKSAAAASQAKAPPDSRSSTVKSDEGLMNPAPTLTPATQCHLPPTECARYCTHAAEPQEHPVVVSPLDILAAAVAASSDGKSDTTPPQGTSPSSSKLSPPSFPLPAIQTRENVSTDVDLVTYLSTPCAPRNDWQILAEQPVESTFKLDASTCDPIASQIIDENDSQLFFKRFFANQNQVIGLLDPELHTPEYVYANSFTLFSVICALGCMGSMRPRDKIIYHGLLQLAEANVQWCIAACVPSLETIQAILLMCHWTPVRRNRLADDHSRLRLCHAIQVARLTKINVFECVAKYIEASNPAADVDEGAQKRRNYERCWLCLFNADTAFSGVKGSHLSISWNEMPKNSHEWWRQPGARQSDQLVSGLVETRGILFNALDERHAAKEKSTCISTWHNKWFHILDHVRRVRCTPNPLLSTTHTSLLGMHIDHLILMLGAHAVRDSLPRDTAAISPTLSVFYERSAKVAVRMLDAILNNPALIHLSPSFSNSQFVMVCHALADVRVAIAENALSEEDATKASSTAIAVTSYLKNIAQDLPSSSAGSLYARLAQSLLGQEQPSGSRQTGSATLTAAILGLDSWSSDWWSTDIFTGNDISFVGAQDFSDCNFDNFDHMQIDESDNIMGTL